MAWRAGQLDPAPDGLRQLDDHLSRLNLDHGTLIVFDQRPEAPPHGERTRFTEDATPSGRTVVLLRA